MSDSPNIHFTKRQISKHFMPKYPEISMILLSQKNGVQHIRVFMKDLNSPVIADIREAALPFEVDFVAAPPDIIMHA